MFTPTELALLSASDAVVDSEDTFNPTLDSRKVRERAQVNTAKARWIARNGIAAWTEYRRLERLRAKARKAASK